MLFVSHDRHFLNSVCTHVADIDYETVIMYTGGYDDMVVAKTQIRSQIEGQNAQRERVAEITRLLARELPEGSRDRTSLKLVLQKRQDKARKYFDELAGKFGRGYVPERIVQLARRTRSRTVTASCLRCSMRRAMPPRFP